MRRERSRREIGIMRIEKKFCNNKRIGKRKNNRKNGMPTIEHNKLIRQRNGIKIIKVLEN